MANSTYNKFQCLVEDLAEKKHNLASDTLKVAFSNASNPIVCVKLDITIHDQSRGFDRSRRTGTNWLQSPTHGDTAFQLFNDTATNKELIASTARTLRQR